MSQEKLQKIVVVTGPTATGKSDIGIALAKCFDGEIISADSRQVYKGMEIGTGAVTAKEADDIPHHLISFCSPKRPFTADNFAKKADKLIANIAKRGKTPIIVGGTGFYIGALLYENALPNVPPNPKLRKELKKKSLEELFSRLGKKDPDRAATIDPHNKRRLIRALEIIASLGKVPHLEASLPSRYDALKIGITLPDDQLKERIRARVKKRLENGWIGEVRTLQQSGVSWKRLAEIGLGYRTIARHMQTHDREESYDKEKLAGEITTAEYQYAKRQKRWFKRDEDITWFNPEEVKEMQQLVEQFTK